MVTQEKMARFQEAKEAGCTHYCPGCWHGQNDGGRCKRCRLHFCQAMPQDREPQSGLRPPHKGPFMTQAQGAYHAEQAWRRARGLPPLVPQTRAQQLIDEGRIPPGPGGDLE